MKIPKYWRKVTESFMDGGKEVVITSWGHSDVSPEDALTRARERLPILRQAYLDRSPHKRYEYYADALREHRIRSWELDGREYAVMTRNGYGALVLNTTSVMFVDIDIAPGVRFLFWGKSTQQKRKEAVEHALDVLRDRGHSVRVYETTSGLRLLLTDRLFEPSAPDTIALMQQLNADPLYLKLCATQACFRARLTPKPWRLDIPRPPERFPEDPTQGLYAQWVEAYEEVTRDRPVCRLVESTGEPAHPEVRAVMQIHDEYCRVGQPGELT